MPDTLTPNYGWVQPQVGGDAATWGATLNTNLGLIDAQVFNNQQTIEAGVAPIGSITMFGGATAPANWLLCQGQTLSQTGTYAALYAVIGGTFNVGTVAAGNFMLPNLQQKFPLGAGPNPLGSAAGAFAVTLATANLPAHNHAISDPGHAHGVSDPTHTHGVSDPTHTHSASQGGHSHGGVVTGLGAGGGPGQAGASMSSQSGRTDTQQPGVSIGAAATGIGIAAAATGVGIAAAATGVTTQNTGSGSAFNVVPPFVAINFMIRYQ